MNYISDLIKESDIFKWKYGNTIFIDAQTGQGKSTFIINILMKFAKENNKTILLLSNRNALKNQNKKLLGISNRKSSTDDGVITVGNYQKLESDLLKGIYPPDYDYIVCDEVHYFFSDSGFNKHTDVLLNYFFQNKNSVMIHMTGTPDTVKYYYEYKGIRLKRKYQTKRNYSYIKDIYMYNNNDNIVKMMSRFELNEKAIVFTTTKNIKEWNKIFEDNSEIFLGTSSVDYELVKKETKNTIAEDSIFNSQFLLTTNGLDCGVNIIDENVKHIIIDYMDTDTLLQCLGRLRPLPNQTINVYIKNRFGEMLSREIQWHQDIITRCDFLMTMGAIEYLKEYPYDRDHYNEYGIFPLLEDDDQSLSYNEARYVKAKYNLQLYKSFVEKYDGYIKYVVKKLLKRGIDDYMNLDEIFGEYDINKLFEDIGINKRLFEDEQKKIKDYFLANVLSFKDSSLSNFNVRTINGYLDDNIDKYNYRIKIGVDYTKENRGKRYWIIERI